MARDIHRASLRLGISFHDGQPDAGTSRRVIGRLEETIKDVRQFFFGNAFTGICHRQFSTGVERTQSDRYRPTFRGELQSIREEII